MSSRSRKSSSRPPSAPAPEENRESEEQRDGSEGDSGATSTETLSEETLPEESAQVQLTIKGSDKSARAAARRFGEGMTKPAPPPITTPGNDAEDPVDPVAALLSDGKNMVLVTRQKPRTVQGPDGREHATNVRIPGAYTCPTSKAEIEELVFQQHGGAKYKCTIHPDTTDGANKILGHFTIEHSDLKCPPYIDGVTVNLPSPEIDTSTIPTEGDPHLKETDPLAMARTALQRRLERAQVRKEIEELEAQVKEMEGTKTASPTVASAEAAELAKLRQEIADRDRQLAEKDRLLSEKKVNDRFDKLEGSIAELTTAIKTGAAVKPAANGEESFMMMMLKQTQQHSKDMIELMKSSSKPAPSPDGDLDKMLDRFQKLQTITGGGPNKGSRGLSSLEEKLIDMSFDRLTNGGGGGDGDEGDVEDIEGAVKLAIKQFAPIAKTYVEKKMDQESQASGGAQLSPDQVKKIYAEAAQAAAKKVQDDLAVQGLVLQQTADGRLIALPAAKGAGKPVVPPRTAGTKVMSETRTAGGVVKKISIKPEDLSGRPKPDNAASAPAPEPAAEPTKGESVPTKGVFPMLGPNGTELKIEFPTRPGEMKYDRRYSVNFVLDGIRSEIRQGIPQKAQVDPKIESYVIGDAIEFLDEEILNQLDVVDSGPALEAILGPSGDAEKISEIKKAGEDEVVASYLRKLVMSIQREWQREKSA